MRKLEGVRRDFVANVSHELRTPLTSIRAMVETLEAGALDDPEVSGEFLTRIISVKESRGSRRCWYRPIRVHVIAAGFLGGCEGLSN